MEINRDIAMMMLEDYGHIITAVDSGIEAIKAYRDHHQDFDIILMDCLMPDMDGFDTTRKIRAFESDNNIAPTKIVALTASAMVESKQACFDAGMDGFISKPFQESELLDTIQSCTAGDQRPLH